VQVVDVCFQDLGFEHWKKSMIGFGADGASVNMGKRQGVAALLKRDTCHLIDIHCLPHRLELSMLELQRECKFVQNVYDILHLVWKTYHYSPKSRRELDALGKELGLDVLKPRPVKGSRWLPHVSGALKVFIKPQKDGNITRDPAQYAAVLTHMEHLATASTNTDVKGRAKFIIKAMKTVSFVSFCHFLADLFEVLSKLSVQFQRNELILPCAVSLLEETVSNITLLCKRPVSGGRLHTFLSSLQASNSSIMFQGIILPGDASGLTTVEITHTGGVGAQIKRATDLCLSGLKERFAVLLQTADTIVPCGPNQAVKDMLVFNHDAWPTNQCELIDFGQQSIERLVTWFQPLLMSKGCCITAISSQWVSLKILVSTQFKDKAYVDLWATLLTKTPYKEDLKDVLHLVEILLVLPISAAQCERAISAQNRIKNDSRSCLGGQTLEELMHISLEGPSLSEFDPDSAVKEWFKSSKRPRRPFLQIEGHTTCAF